MDEYDNLTEAVQKALILQQAKSRFTATDSEQSALKSLYRKYMNLYDPIDGDQWPDDLDERPDMIHMSLNLVKPAVDIESRLQSIIPRLSLTPPNPNDSSMKAVAEAVEKAFFGWLDDTMWEVWLADQARARAIFGRTIWKPLWNEEEKRPDLVPIETPGNLRIGWSGSDFRKKDWALFEYEISPLEAMARWPEIEIEATKKEGEPLKVAISTDHADPLNTIPNAGFSGLTPGGGTTGVRSDVLEQDFFGKKVHVWDYWYKENKDKKQRIVNCLIVEGVILHGPEYHDEYPDLPYIVVENDHRTGSPNGISTVKAIVDLQEEYNRIISNWAQQVADHTDPSWALEGETADEIEEGIVPKHGEVTPTGVNNTLKRLDENINPFPMERLVDEFWRAFHRITGLTEVLFGALPGSQISGRALAVQIEAAANRIGPKRNRLYRGIRELFKYWTVMVEKKKVKVTVMDEEGAPQEVLLGKLIRSAGRWKIVPPEITPQDVLDLTTTVINQVNGKLIKLATGMDKIGVESPEDELRGIMEERNNIDLFPGDVQVKAAVISLLQQLGQQMEAMQALAGAQSQNQIENAEAQPTLGPEAGGAGQQQPLPASQPGQPGGALSPQTLIRNQPSGQAQNLQQITIK